MVSRYFDLPSRFLRAASAPGSVLLHSAKPDTSEHTSWLYTDPIDVLLLEMPDGIEAFLAEVERRRRGGRWLAGWLGYEAGYPLVGVGDPPEVDEPAAWLGVYDGVWRFDHFTNEVVREGAEAEELGTGDIRDTSLPRLGPFGLDRDAYRAKLERIHEYLSTGDTYQVNFTDRFEATFDRDEPGRDPCDPRFDDLQPRDLRGRGLDRSSTDAGHVGRGSLVGVYRKLSASQPVSYAAFVHAGDVQVASFSPELFFRVRGRQIATRPMKGTAPRGRDNNEDAELADALAADEKSRAENVMIVDLLRNDLGRVCVHGSVRVSMLFEVERYRTVQQMTSTVLGTLRQEVTISDVIAALFPCGSVTGAPKRRTMQIIRELERVPRGVYTGAIGHVTPNGDATFNVAIRTLLQTGSRTGLQTKRIVLGAGAGIVADSDPTMEYEECRLKARFATQVGRPFELIETMRWEAGFRLLDEHMARLRDSAVYFGFAFDAQALRRALLARAERFAPGSVQRVAVRLPASGAFRVEAQPFVDGPTGDLRIAVADERVDSGDPFLRHKTTRRELYERARARAERTGLADILFLNERDEVTEGAISNVFVELDGSLSTPPVDAGVLPGVYRAYLLSTAPSAREATLTLTDLLRADRVWLCSSLRGRRSAVIVGSPQLGSPQLASPRLSSQSTPDQCPPDRNPTK